MKINNSDEIKIKLSATNQSGIIAALHLIANKFDLKVKDNLVSKVSRERNRVVVIFEGTLNASQTEFTNAIKSHSRIYSIDDVEVKPNQKIYAYDDYKFDKSDYIQDDTDFESIVKEFQDIEFEADSDEYENDDTEYETELDEDSESELDQNINSENLTETESFDTEETPDIEHSSLKVFRKISYKFNANDSLTEEALEITEQIFRDIFGPVASLFVSTAIIEANTIGELFLILSEELDGEVKTSFLALVKDLDINQSDLS